MKQPVRKGVTSTKTVKKKTSVPKQKRNHPQYGTSKLEEFFAHEFLDKLGVKYEYQFEAKDIGRYFDFYLPESRLIIEVDGDYYHSNPLIYEDKELSPMQKKNMRVDAHKTQWALLHGYPIMRIWENDIRKNPKKVMKELKERLYIANKEIEKKNNWKIRH